jgi:hypothetical protein
MSALETGAMMETLQWLQQNWLIITGTIIFGVGGFYVPWIRSFLLVIFKTFFSEKVLKVVFISFAEAVVKSTKNKLDDLWLAQVKKELGMLEEPEK